MHPQPQLFSLTFLHHVIEQILKRGKYALWVEVIVPFLERFFDLVIVLSRIHIQQHFFEPQAA